MVMAVDAHDGVAKHIGKASPLLDLHLMDQLMPHIAGIRMIERVGELIWQVRVQRPAERHIHHLAPAADAEERFAVLCGGSGEGQLDGVAFRLHVGDARMRLTGEMVKGDVASTGEENPIQFGVKRVPAIVCNKRWNQNRDTSRLVDGIRIRLL